MKVASSVSIEVKIYEENKIFYFFFSLITFIIFHKLWVFVLTSSAAGQAERSWHKKLLADTARISPAEKDLEILQ